MTENKRKALETLKKVKEIYDLSELQCVIVVHLRF